MKTKIYYINWNNQYNGIETVDETTTYKDAKYLVNEYNLAFNGGCYISQRCTNEWRVN